MAELNEKQKALLEARLKYLEGKPCPICGSKNERILYTDVFQYFSVDTSKEINTEKAFPFIPVGIIVCPECDHIESFRLPYDE